MIGTYLSVLRRRLGLIALLTLVLTPIAFVALNAGGRSHESTAVVQIGSRLAAGVVGLDTPYEDAETLLATETQFFEGTAVAELAHEDLMSQGWDETADELRGQVTATGRGTSNLMDVTGADGDAERARQLTDAFVQAYVSLRQESQRTAVQSVVDDLQTQRDTAEAELNALPANPTTAAAQRERESAQSWLASVDDQLERARLRLSVDTSGVVLVSPAGPAEQSELLPAPLAAVAALVGALLLAAGTALLLDLLRDPVRTRAEAAELLSAPVVGVLPTGPDALGTSGGSAAAAARGARLRIETLTGGTAPRAVAVTAVPRDAVEATRVGAALAAAWGRAGLRVVLVADPATPALRATLADSPGDIGAGVPAFHTSLPGVWLVPSVASATTGSGLAEHPHPDTVLSALRRVSDVVVVVDARAEVPDTAAAATLLDAVFAVCVLERTPGRQVSDLAATLDQFGIAVDGVLLARATGRPSQHAAVRQSAELPAERHLPEHPADGREPTARTSGA